MESKESKSDKVFSFIDNIKNSAMSNSKKLSDSLIGSSSSSDNSSVLLTSDIKTPVSPSVLRNSSKSASEDSLVKGEPLSIDGSVKNKSTPSGSWLNVSKTTRIWLKVIVVIVLLGIVGINVFLYLGFSFKTIYGLFDKLVNYIKNLISGGKSTPKPKPKPKTKDLDKTPSESKGDNTMKDLENEIEEPLPVKKNNVKPDEDPSSIHSSGKSGFCNVGSWKGIRSCVKVKSANECVSGDIFPTKDICVNPNLRH
jgi:hypothetical protein